MGSMMMPKYKGSANLPTNGEMPADVAKIGYLRKLKTMKKKYMVLRLESDQGPARLEYYDSEKKCRAGQVPKRSIVLKNCFNINRKMDSKHKFALALYTRDDCFALVAESEGEMDAWLAALLSLQQGDADWGGGPEPKPNFEHVWQVNVKNKGLGSNRNIIGPHHLCLTSKTLSLVKMNAEQSEPLEFPLMSIRRCGHSDCFFFMELGRSAITGCGELWMATEDNIIAQNMHEAILGAMKSSRKYEEAFPPIRPRSLSTSENNNSGKSGTPSGASGGGNTSSSRPIGVVKPQVTHGGSSSSVSAVSSSVTGIRERCDSMPSRSRTVSEGHHDLSSNRSNHHFDALRPHSSVYAYSISYSPPMANNILSPGSVAYSDSAGSSLSIDDFESDYHHSRFLNHSLEGSLHTEPTITEEPPDDYLTMSPGNTDPLAQMISDMGSSSSQEPSGLDYMEMAVGNVQQTQQTRPRRLESSYSSEDYNHSIGAGLAVSNGRKQMHLNLNAQQMESCPTSPTTDYMEMASPSSCSALADVTAGEGYIPMSPVGSLSVELSKRTPTSLVSVEGHSSQSPETFSGYLPMAPVRENEGYMDMNVLSSSLPKNTSQAICSSASNYMELTSPSRSSHSLQDISYGSSPTTHRIEEFHLDKVKSFFPPSEDDSEVYIKPARAYSIGSRPQVQKSHLAAHLETSRVRAYSFGSQAASSRRREPSNVGGIEAELGSLRKIDARNKKSSSAPLLPSATPQTPTTSSAIGATPITSRASSRSSRTNNSDHNEDLMEIVYNQPAYVRMKPEEHHGFSQSSYVRMKQEEQPGSRRYSMGSHWQRSNSRSGHDAKTTSGKEDKKIEHESLSRSRKSENEYIDMPKPSGSGKNNLRDEAFDNSRGQFECSKKELRKGEFADYPDNSKNTQKIMNKSTQNLPIDTSPVTVPLDERDLAETYGNKKSLLKNQAQKKASKQMSECSDYMEMGGHQTPSLRRSAYSLDTSSGNSSQNNTANPSGDYVNLDMNCPTLQQLETKSGQQTETKVRQQPETKIRQQPETKVRQQPETKVRQQPETKVRQQPETKVRQQLETKVRHQPETKVCQQSESKVRLQPETKVWQLPETKPLLQPETIRVEPKTSSESHQVIAPTETHPHDYMNIQPGGGPPSEEPIGASEFNTSKDQSSHKANSTKMSINRTSDALPLVKQASVPLVTASLKETPAARKSSCPIPTANKNNHEGKRNLRRASQSPERLVPLETEVAGSRRSLVEGPYENIQLGTPRQLSMERQLNYASLDLAPATASDEVPRSPRVLKGSSAEGSETTLSYAEIDFTKSEGLRNTSGSLREGRV